MNARFTRRAGPLFGVWLVAAAFLAVFAPAVPNVSALDPTPDPSAASPAASASESPSDTPSEAPSPSDTTESPSPAVDPSPSAEPSASVDPSPSEPPSGSPDPSPSDQPSGSPEPSPSTGPSATEEPSPSPAIRLLSPLLSLSATVNPTSPHIVSGLTSDVCAACHATHRASNGALQSSVYRASPLRLRGEAYSSRDFGLCFSCHSGAQQAALEDTTGTSTGTNFPGHGFHLRSIGTFGSGGTDITVPGDGQGNALCAECHYNVHGTATDARGLVLFAPDVEPYNGQPIAYDATSGTCTLTCHGVGHDGAVVPAP